MSSQAFWQLLTVQHRSGVRLVRKLALNKYSVMKKIIPLVMACASLAVFIPLPSDALPVSLADSAVVELLAAPSKPKEDRKDDKGQTRAPATPSPKKSVIAAKIAAVVIGSAFLLGAGYAMFVAARTRYEISKRDTKTTDGLLLAQD